MKLRSDKRLTRKGRLFLKKNNDLPFDTPLGSHPKAIMARCKARACKILAKNYLMIQRSFRRTVAKYRGNNHGIGFKSLRNTQTVVWRARVKKLNCEDAVALHGESGIIVDDRTMYPSILTDVLVHEALHHWCYIKKRWLGSTLDHLCMQDLGADTEPDATLAMAKRRYPLVGRV